MPRRHEIGTSWESCGLPFRLVPGRKRSMSTDPEDRDGRLEWLTPTGWVAITFEPLAQIFDCLYENEEALYPSDRTKTLDGRQYSGGEKVWTFLRTVKRRGINFAMTELRHEKAQRSLFDPPDGT